MVRFLFFFFLFVFPVPGEDLSGVFAIVEREKRRHMAERSIRHQFEGQLTFDRVRLDIAGAR